MQYIQSCKTTVSLLCLTLLRVVISFEEVGGHAPAWNYREYWCRVLYSTSLHTFYNVLHFRLCSTLYCTYLVLSTPLYSTQRYSTELFSTLLCQCGTVLLAVLHSAVQYSTLLSVQYSIVQYMHLIQWFYR